MRLLSMHDHSRYQLQQKLIKKDFSEEKINAVLNDLEQRQYLNDERYAEHYVHFRSSKGYGPVRIARELQEKGLSQNTVDDALSVNDDQWLSLLKKQLDKKFGNKPPLNFSERAKRARFLEYRGFPPWMIRDQLFD